MSPTVEAFYWLPHCTTCQKAEAFLMARGVKILTYVDVKNQAVPKATLQKLAHGVGGVASLFSKRALKYRSLGLHEQTLSDADMLDWMAKEYTFIRRPVVVFTGSPTLAGFSAKQYDAVLRGK